MNNKYIYLIIGFIGGIVLSSIGWWIFRAYELSPILAERDVAPFLVLANTQKAYQNVVKELNHNNPQSIVKAKQCALITVEAFVDYYELLVKKHPNIRKQEYFHTEYMEAKQFLKKYKKNQNESVELTEKPLRDFQ